MFADRRYSWWGTVTLVAVGVSASAVGAQQPPTGAAAFVFDNVTVVDVAQGKLVPAQRVVVSGNRIQAMGGVAAVKTPQGATVIDAAGKYLIPGLWDLHVHTTSDLPYPLMLANGVTGFRDGWSYVPLDTMLRWRKEILDGTKAGPPRQLLTGDFSSLGQLSADEIKARLAKGANFIKVYPFDFAAAAAARQVGVPFGGHLQGISAIEASDSGMKVIDHVNSAGDLDQLCMGPEASVERCQPVAERFRRNNTWWVPTLTRRLHFNREATPNPGPAADAVRDRYDQVVEQFWSGSAPTGDWLRGAVSVGRGDSPGFFSIIQRVGLPILNGTDTDIGPDAERQMPPGLATHEELAIYVAEGMTPLAALQTATLNPAKLLNATDSLGTVAPGKLADLVLLDGDPLSDITNTTAIRAVVQNGHYFDRAALDRLVAEVQAKAKQGFRYWWSDGPRDGTIDDTP